MRPIPRHRIERARQALTTHAYDLTDPDDFELDAGDIIPRPQILTDEEHQDLLDAVDDYLARHHGTASGFTHLPEDTKTGNPPTGGEAATNTAEALTPEGQAAARAAEARRG